MRIISGSLKGRRITIPGNLPVRPTTDLAKESLFNILNNNVSFEKIRVLDLFAGTGCITYEFSSRGCNDITAVDLNYRCCKFIADSVKKFNLQGIRIIRSDALQFLRKSKSRYDLIFADPPYDFEWIDEIPGLVFSNQLLFDEGLLVIEHPRHISFTSHKNFMDHRLYGMVHFSFLKNS